MSIPMLLLLATAMLTASCAPTGPGKDDGRDWIKPIRVGLADKLTPETTRERLAHNQAWARICRKPSAG